MEIAKYKFDGLEQTTRRLTLPDFAESATAEWLDETITGNRLSISLTQDSHNVSRPHLSVYQQSRPGSFLFLAALGTDGIGVQEGGSHKVSLQATLCPMEAVGNAISHAINLFHTTRIVTSSVLAFLCGTTGRKKGKKSAHRL